MFLIPALVALASLAIARLASSPAMERPPLPSRTTLLLASPLLLYVAYLLIGALARLAFIYEVRPNVRLSAALAVAATRCSMSSWPKLSALDRKFRQHLPDARGSRGGNNRDRWSTAGNVVQFAQWAAGRTYANYEASVALGKLLPAGTLVHGKLANGLALENRIKPIFVGRNFGNYDDRLRRDDVPYVLTYVAPREGYEGPVILDVLEKYPQRRILWTFDVRETPGGTDRAALMEKGPPAVPAPALDLSAVRLREGPS